MSVVADHLRSHKSEIADAWEQALRSELQQLAPLDRATLLDHLPEVLDALAAWIEGEGPQADKGFAALAEGHALQRLALGVDLVSLHTEYACLRRVILTQLLALGCSHELRHELIHLDEALDRAFHLAVQQFTARRDTVRERFIGILAHDLRSPLTAAAMAAEGLWESPDVKERDRRRVRIIRRTTERMDRMIHDVLDFARGHLGGGIPVTPATSDLAEICRAAVEEAVHAHPNRRIEAKLEGDLRGAFDRDRVLQAIGNLIANALEHGSDPITVHAWEAGDRHAVFTRVTNAGGKPIPKKLIPTLFEPFVRASGEDARGLGLGLYIVAEIARAHGATCEVGSSEAETAFTIRWPRTPPEEIPQRP